MKRILIFIAALAVAASVSGCFIVERDEDREHHRYRDRDQERGQMHDRDFGRGYGQFNGW